jgi:hypothetical protein
LTTPSTLGGRSPGSFCGTIAWVAAGHHETTYAPEGLSVTAIGAQLPLWEQIRSYFDLALAVHGDFWYFRDRSHFNMGH